MNGLSLKSPRNFSTSVMHSHSDLMQSLTNSFYILETETWVHFKISLKAHDPGWWFPPWRQKDVNVVVFMFIIRHIICVCVHVSVRHGTKSNGVWFWWSFGPSGALLQSTSPPQEHYTNPEKFLLTSLLLPLPYCEKMIIALTVNCL